MLVLSVWVLLYGISFYFAEDLSVAFGFRHLITVTVLTVYFAAFLYYSYRTHKLQSLGIRIPTDIRQILYILVILLSIPIVNICLSDGIILKNQKLLHFFVDSLLFFYTVFFEELLFRGVFPDMLKERFGTSTAVSAVISNTVFAAIHTGSLNYIGGMCLFSYIFIVFSVGMCFSSIKDSTQSILPCFILHFAINISSLCCEDTFFYVSPAGNLVFFTVAILCLIHSIHFYFIKEAVK